jgi:hypothetical protein
MYPGALWVLTGFRLIPLLGLFHTPSCHLYTLAYLIVTHYLLLGALLGLPVFVPPFLSRLRNDFLDVGDDKVLRFR